MKFYFFLFRGFGALYRMDASIYVIAPLPPTALIFQTNSFSLAPFPTLLSCRLSLKDLI